MQSIESLQLKAWQEVARHADLREALRGVALALAERAPLALALVRRIDLKRQRLETIAVVALNPDFVPPTATRTSCSPSDLTRLLTWGRQGRVLSSRDAEAASLLELIVPEGVTGDLLAGPLNDEGSPAGLLLLAAAPGCTLRGDDAELLTAILDPLTAALENHRRMRELERLRDAVEADRSALLDRLGRQDIVDSIVGAESGLRGAIERIDQVAPTDTPALILGEAGNGREAIARTIHTRSLRADAPFVRVNCSSIPRELMSAELFGVEPGALSGHESGRRGRIERADGGTLFLDEVSALSAPAQTQLLKLLTEGSFARVGAQHRSSIDVRLVLATQHDLPALVAQGKFRQDLWEHISVFPIHLPPLRERPEDIPALAAHFAWRAGQRLGGAPLVTPPESINLLLSYSWPGNVRELATVIERAAVLGDGKRLEIEAAMGFAGLPRPTGASPADTFASLEAGIARHIEAALRGTHGRIEGPRGAAALLGVNPNTLRSRMRRMGIDWRQFRGLGT
jgi:transcriptional regulator with GAF, ATPase, and Fis domain